MEENAAVSSSSDTQPTKGAVDISIHTDSHSSCRSAENRQRSAAPGQEKA